MFTDYIHDLSQIYGLSLNPGRTVRFDVVYFFTQQKNESMSRFNAEFRSTEFSLHLKQVECSVRVFFQIILF